MKKLKVELSTMNKTEHLCIALVDEENVGKKVDINVTNLDKMQLVKTINDAAEQLTSKYDDVAHLRHSVGSMKNPFEVGTDEDMPQKKRMTIRHKRVGFEKARQLILDL